MTKNAQRIADLGFDRLKEVMCNRLHGAQSIGPPCGPRGGPAPYEWLVDEFRRGDSGLRDRMTAVMRDFLPKVADHHAWPKDARYELLDLVQECGEGVVDEVRGLIDTQAFLPDDAAGHAGLLKCLISLGHLETPDFWMEQSRIIDPRYGALVFRGLAEHSLELAADALPELCGDSEALANIGFFLRALQERVGVSEVFWVFTAAIDALPGEVAQVLRDHLQVRPTARNTHQVIRFAEVRKAAKFRLLDIGALLAERNTADRAVRSLTRAVRRATSVAEEESKFRDDV